MDFRRRYRVLVLGIWRKTQLLNEELSRVRRAEGDVLVLQGSAEAFATAMVLTRCLTARQAYRAIEPASGHHLPCCSALPQPSWRRASGRTVKPTQSSARVRAEVRLAAIILVELLVLVALIILAATVVIPLAAPPTASPTPGVPAGVLRDCPRLVPGCR